MKITPLHVLFGVGLVLATGGVSWADLGAAPTGPAPPPPPPTPPPGGGGSGGIAPPGGVRPGGIGEGVSGYEKIAGDIGPGELSYWDRITYGPSLDGVAETQRMFLRHVWLPASRWPLKQINVDMIKPLAEGLLQRSFQCGGCPPTWQEFKIAEGVKEGEGGYDAGSAIAKFAASYVGVEALADLFDQKAAGKKRLLEESKAWQASGDLVQNTPVAALLAPPWFGGNEVIGEPYRKLNPTDPSSGKMHGTFSSAYPPRPDLTDPPWTVDGKTFQVRARLFQSSNVFDHCNPGSGLWLPWRSRELNCTLPARQRAVLLGAVLRYIDFKATQTWPGPMPPHGSARGLYSYRLQPSGVEVWHSIFPPHPEDAPWEWIKPSTPAPISSEPQKAAIDATPDPTPVPQLGGGVGDLATDDQQFAQELVGYTKRFF